MKKTIYALILATGCCTIAQAQISKGGLPLSLISTEPAISNQVFTPVYAKTPDLKRLKQEDNKVSRSKPGAYHAGVLAPVDMAFPASGTMVTLSDGRKVWRAQMNMGDVPSMVLYYDHFKLPQGVKFFVSNSNGKQLLGAYTAENNNEDGLFANQEVQGGIVNFELDIDKGVNTDDISWHLNQAGVMYYPSVDLQRYAGNEDIGTAAKPTDDPLAGRSSVCEINAICPEGQSYPQQRKATMRIVMPLGGGYVGFCTGTLINTTKGDCTPYVLTATHCEDNNSKTNTPYSQWIFYFNFEAPDCAGNTVAPNNQTLTGAQFVARADYNPNSASILGDFLLVKLNNKVPATFGAYFAGWNRASSLPSPSTYINFHHPSGDMKKLAITNTIAGNGTFNQWSVPGTHWAVMFNTGGNEEGSSGSGLFDVNGRLVGDLSGGSDNQSCDADTNKLGDQAILGQDAVYSKLSRNWEYPEGNGVQNAQLKPWLDPTNTGAMTTNTIEAAATCSSPTTGISKSAELDNAVNIFPNPVVNGTLRMRANLDKATDLSVTIYDITGARKAVYTVAAHNGEYTFDLSSYANGAYLVAISNGTATTSRKIVVSH
ncbi:T9SS type A sorting domain-containing protein [Taibaiella koreensis]|uniref:T9SS type A sorting domain-containing protein n=1 Tax=Taibaiella koreensis TaxID=1268548 RepID=UPI000E59CAE9|nr:T9SS type A sorting domain-containing protein [Taibaiella koreensis]